MSTGLDGRYERYEGLHVLRLSGDDYQMGWQHGRLLRDAIPHGPLPYYSEYVEHLLRAGFLGALAGPLSRGLGFAMGRTVGRRIAAGFPEDVLRAMDGLADGAGISRERLLRAVTMPETYLWVLSRYKAWTRAPVAPRYGVPFMGCTSAIAWGGATTDGSLLHGRNFDYQGVGYWDREQAVVFCQPDDGQPFVSIAAAGILFGGITAMNASGLTMVVHQHMAAADFALGGTPVGVVGDQIMRHATCLDDARRLLDDHRPNGPWTYLVCSDREQAVLCYEITAHRRAWFHPQGDTFGYANIYLSPELDDAELFFYPTYWRNCTGRHHRANALLAEGRGGLDPDGIAAIMGDPGHPRCRLRDNISMLYTVASVVFEPRRGRTWVATGRAPVCNNPYVAFDLDREGPVPEAPPLEGGTRVAEGPRAAMSIYREAYEVGFNRGDLRAARRKVERARELDPTEPIYAFVAGLLALVHDEPVAALDRLDHAVELGHPDEARVAAFHLWRARSRDRLGDRVGALRDYREAIRGDPAVRSAGQRGLRRPWRRRGFAIEWSFGEVVSP